MNDSEIFYIANVRIPTEKAHGIQIMKTCEAMAKNGAKVTLVVPRRLNKIKADPFVYYGVKRNFSIVKVPTIDLVSFGRIGFLIETIIFSELAVWFIRLKKIKNKVIYSRDAWPILNVTLLGWKTFWEAHMGSESFMTKTVLRHVSGIVVISEGLKNLYLGLGANPEKIFASPDAVDLSDFLVEIDQNEIRTRLGIPVGKKVAMYVGLFDKWKGYETLLEASKLIQSEEIVVVMVGGRDEQIAQLKLEYPYVVFAGYRNYTELPENQKVADVLVIPNSAKYPISKLYTSPLKLFAHMASGVPIIASDLPSIREVVDENEARFFTPDDPADLAKKIKEVCFDDGKTAVEMAENALKKVEMYTWDNRAVGILRFIKKYV